MPENTLFLKHTADMHK